LIVGFCKKSQVDLTWRKTAVPAVLPVVYKTYMKNHIDYFNFVGYGSDNTVAMAIGHSLEKTQCEYG